MHSIDVALYRNLNDMQFAYNAMLSTRANEVTAAELALEDKWRNELETILRDLYWYPLRSGISEAPDTEEEIRSWLEDRYSDELAVAALLTLLLRYQRLAVDVGGQMALTMLDDDGVFRLTNSGYLAQIEQHAKDLTTQGAELSLIDTTINDLSRGIVRARESEDNTLTVLATAITGWALIRAGWIAVTELTRSVGDGVNWTFLENEVAYQQFVTREDRRVCQICMPLHGLVMPTTRIPAALRVPIHVGCRCTYAPVLSGWVRPNYLWTGT